ncbi:MAG: MBL fold metallo-hydrolase, partial [Spirochaetota bacterium]
MVERIVVGLLYTNAYIFSSHKKECYIIDPGGNVKDIIARLNIKNLIPKGILCTHGHLDHVAGVGQLKEHYLQKGIELKVAIHKADAHYLGSKARDSHKRSFNDFGPEGMEYFKTIFSKLPEPDLLLNDGDIAFDSALKTLYTPGHTAGSVSFYSEN